MELQVIRNVMGPEATEGQMLVDGVNECVTLEPVVREIPGQPVADWKIDGVTAIPAGTYPVTVSMSEHLGYVTPLLENIEDFDGVRIHIGNTHTNTEGCILVGQAIDGADFIGDSHAAFEPLLAKIQTALANCEEVNITVGAVEA